MERYSKETYSKKQYSEKARSRKQSNDIEKHRTCSDNSTAVSYMCRLSADTERSTGRN